MEFVQYNREENYLLMPNEIFGMLVKDVELNQKKAPHVAFAYTYTFLITWLYRYTKYGQLELNNVSKKAIFKIMGIAETSKEYDYIIKKGGVLDRLGITMTHSFTQAPITWFFEEEGKHDFIQFNFFEDLNEEIKRMMVNGATLKRRHIKEPLLATGYRNPLNEEIPEVFNGTFFEGGKEYTHMVGMDAFIKCMTTQNLGFNAFYLLSFLRSRYGKNTYVNISLETISEESGIKPTTRDFILKMLKAYNMIICDPTNFCLGRGEYRTEASTYWLVKNSIEWKIEPNFNFPKRKVFHVSTHKDYIENN